MTRWVCATLLAFVLALQFGAAVAKQVNYVELTNLIKTADADELKRALPTRTANELSLSGRMVLMSTAIGHGKPDAVTVLVNWGIGPNHVMTLATNGEQVKLSPLLYAISARVGLPTVSALVKGGAKPNLEVDELLPLNFAIGLAQFDVANYLLDNGANARALEASTSTPLMELALTAEDADPVAAALAQRLIAAGVDVNARGPQGISALRWAVLGGKRDLVKLMLAARADPNSADNKGETLLQLARRKQFTDIADLLLAAGAKP